MKQLDWQNLLEKLSQASDEDAVEAAKLLSQQYHEQSILSLIQFARSKQPPHRRELALYALAWMHNPQFVDTFIQILGDLSEVENVRGQAAEALGMLFDQNSGQIYYHKAESALLEHVSDLSPVVRFWCCYGLGNMRSHRAVEQLKAIQAQDHVLCPGWWYVSKEAEDALARIVGQGNNDPTLANLATFAEEDRVLAELGMSDYTAMLEQED
ncbi:HEAT repeat domain-containing protein [Gloeocapsopsis crepidinum LEGE 06123]|uniref:HEAT repeat domain-containing protein n=1 Tax=Gloeocapsopsis crepidinum LEGE 06123 TaxID=588587 RepID=A0ABR9UP32_9CHRO|nr:HEAT repeat domain-containing protein [Gloeocapsopsis crepidinum]MBE9190046.1 HEAT repeat domain-containing protein [Gloeocapsopsis crepidinum LEGE 06123]